MHPHRLAVALTAEGSKQILAVRQLTKERRSHASETV